MSIAHNRSRFTQAEAAQLARELYGLTVTARPLPSERDQNFHLRDDSGGEYVLKIASAADGEAILALQNNVIGHLAAHGLFPAPMRVHPTITGESIATVNGHGPLRHFVRLLSYQPGKPLGDVRPHSPELLHGLGAFLGRMDAALADFPGPVPERHLKWDVAHASHVIRGHIDEIELPARRALVAHFLAHFEARAEPQLSTLRPQLIHNDANDYNVLIDAGRVSGIIDFGDLVTGPPLYDLAIAAAYAILNKADVLAAARPLLAGYHAAHPLTEAEIALLYPLIAIRLATSVTLSAHQQKLEPHNDYLRISEAPAWVALQKLADLPPALAHYTFRAACGLPPNPKSAAVIRWLAQQPVASPVEPPLTPENVHVLDLSVGSLDIPQLDDLADTAAFSRSVFAQMAAAGARVGVGRYNEARLLYAAPEFTVESDELPETRTIHLGLDLFLPAGSPVLAPLEGIVHAMQNNAAPKDYGPTIILRHQTGGGDTFFTLYGHLSADSLDGLAVGDAVQRGQRIARIGDFPTNGDWPPHLHFQIITDLLDSPAYVIPRSAATRNLPNAGEAGDSSLPLVAQSDTSARAATFPGVAAPSQRDVWLGLSPDPNLLLRIPAECFPPPPFSPAENLQRRRERIGPSLSISYEKHLKIVRGHRQFLFDDAGRAYLDAVNNVPHVGHNHPQVVRAGQRQMAVLNTNTRYLHDNLVRYAERLTATMPEPLRVCFFVCSGSEANDLALRLARTHTARRDVVILEGAYHGNLTSLIEISPYKYDGPGGPGRPAHVQEALMPEPYRGPYKLDDPQVGEKYAAHVQQAIERIEAQGRGVAAFVAESLLGCGGQVVLPPGYLPAAYAHVRAAGGVCIADEVQVGFGRVGTHFWGFETQGVTPDIVTLGKPIGNGHPLAAVITTPEIAASFNNGMEYFNTFGGNPVSCAIGMAVLDVVEQEGLQANALRVGNRLLAGLRQLQPKYPLIGDARGLGLYIGVELVRDRDSLAPAAEEASYIANRMRDHGILISTDGPLHNVLKMKPPLVFTAADAERLVTTLDKILQEDAVQV